MQRRFANVVSRFAIERTIYQICLKIFSLAVDKIRKNNLCMHRVSDFYYYLINTQELLFLNLFILLQNCSFHHHLLFFGDN